jgi:hypothetical protein
MLLHKVNTSIITFRDLTPQDQQNLAECKVCSAVVRRAEQYQHKLFHNDLRSLAQEITRLRREPSRR